MCDQCDFMPPTPPKVEILNAVQYREFHLTSRYVVNDEGMPVKQYTLNGVQLNGSILFIWTGRSYQQACKNLAAWENICSISK